MDGRSRLTGLAVLDADGKPALTRGVAADPRIAAMLRDADWRIPALERRFQPILLKEARFIALASQMAGGALVLFFEPPGDTTLRFLLEVDFAFDIIEHLLVDPFDAMTVIDAKGRVVFLSPVHEKFFGLAEGEAAGKDVRDVIENTRLHHVVRTGVAEIGQLQKMRGDERVVSRQPIRHGGKTVGAIGRVMFKGPEQVEALARRVRALEEEIATYKRQSNEARQDEAALAAIVGDSAAIRTLRDEIRRVAAVDVPVLVLGESGVGKELVAQALHRLSRRRDGPLVTVNAAALPAGLVEAELFGYEAGAFTGADRKGRAGRFEQADKGTIFLDEIGDMPLETQSKLLRVLQDRTVERVGGGKPRRIDFRLVSATHRNLEGFVSDSRFRLDLFYRISPVTITMPPLSERMDDAPLLVAHFLDDLARQYGRDVPSLAPDVIDFIRTRSWPGNVRELRHAVERAFVFCDGDVLRVEHFRKAPDFGKPAESSASCDAAAPVAARSALKDAYDDVERRMIAETLARFNGNKKKTAEQLGISRSYLYKKLAT